MRLPSSAALPRPPNDGIAKDMPAALVSPLGGDYNCRLIKALRNFK